VSGVELQSSSMVVISLNHRSFCIVWSIPANPVLFRTIQPLKVETSLTLNLLMSYTVYGVACKARNFKVVYIWTYVWQRWKPSISTCCTMFQHWINAESFPVLQLCVNTLPATKFTLITDGIQFGSLRVKPLCQIRVPFYPDGVLYVSVCVCDCGIVHRFAFAVCLFKGN
jgi:hypothetical protein